MENKAHLRKTFLKTGEYTIYIHTLVAHGKSILDGYNIMVKNRSAVEKIAGIFTLETTVSGINIQPISGTFLIVT